MGNAVQSNLTDWIVFFGPAGELQGGLAKENDSLAIRWIGDPPQRSSSADGRAVCISADPSHPARVTLRYSCGEMDNYFRLMQMYKINKGINGPLTIQNARTNESYEFDCAVLVQVSDRIIGHTADGSNTFDFIFEGECVSLNPPNSVAQSASEGITQLGVI